MRYGINQSQMILASSLSSFSSWKLAKVNSFSTPRLFACYLNGLRLIIFFHYPFTIISFFRTLTEQAILVQTRVFILFICKQQAASQSFFVSVLSRLTSRSQILTSESMSLKGISVTLGILGMLYSHKVRILIKISKVFSSMIWLGTDMLNYFQSPRPRTLSVSSNWKSSSCSQVLKMILCIISSVFLSQIFIVMQTVYFLPKVGRTISKGRLLLQGACSFLGYLGTSFFALLGTVGFLSNFFICMGSTQLAYLRGFSIFSSYLRGGVLYAKLNLVVSSLDLKLQGLYSGYLLGLLEGTGLSLFWELDRIERNKRVEDISFGYIQVVFLQIYKNFCQLFYKNSLQSHLIQQFKGNKNKSRQRDLLRSIQSFFQKKIKKLKEKYNKIFHNVEYLNSSSFSLIPINTAQTTQMVYAQSNFKSSIQKDIIQNLSEGTGLHDHAFFQQHCSISDAQIIPLGQKCADISEEIKEEYRRWLMQKFKSRNIMFELFVVFHVKVTCMVARDIFEGVDVDQQMEKQWCIILYYSILGVKVHEKMYDILVRRFVNVQPQKSKKQGDIVSTVQSINKKQKKSVFSLQTKTRKNIDVSPPMKRLRTIKNIRYSNSSCCQKENEVKKSELEYFQTELRQNLNVKPLPKIKRKRMKIQEFQRIMTEPSTIQSNFFSQKDDRDKDKEENEYKFKSMFTNQLSTALKINHPEKLEFELNSKKVRLNQTMQNFSRENRMAVFENRSQKENFSLFAVGTVSQHISQGKLHVDEWSTLVNNLKRKVFLLNSKNDANKGHLPQQSPLAIQKHSKKKDCSFDSLKASKHMTPV